MTTKKTKTTKKTVTAKKATPTKKAVSSSFRGETARRVTKAIKKVAKANTTKVIDLNLLQRFQRDVQIFLKEVSDAEDSISKVQNELDAAVSTILDAREDFDYLYRSFCTTVGLDPDEGEEPQKFSEEVEEEDSDDDDPDSRTRTKRKTTSP